ncbi:MAG TPA: hypothetical protein VI035_07640 [Solirubrobacterales bacterium]
MKSPTEEREMTNRDTIEIRLLGLEDGGAIARLAELDTTDPPASPLLGAIVDGRLLAAHSLATGASIADPFRHTAEIRSLLAEKVRQARGDHDRGLLRRLRERLGSETGARSGVAEPNAWNTQAADRSYG